nr:hypothetical protein [Tanacetum cinerariifolium]
MDIVAERAARKEAKSEVQSSLKPSPVAGDESYQGDGSGSEEGDDNGSKEEGDEEEDKKEGDKKDDEEEGDEEEDEKEGDEEEDEEEGEGEVVMSKEKKIKVKDKEVGEKTRKKDSVPSSSKDEKPLKKTKGGKKGKGPSKPAKKVLSDNQIRREKFLSEYLPLLSRTVNIDTLPNRLARFVVRAFDNKTYNFYLKTEVFHVTAKKLSQFAPKKKKQIFATDIAEKLRIRKDTNSAGVDWCDFIHRCLAISHEPNTVSGFYNGPLCFLIMYEILPSVCIYTCSVRPAIKNWSTKNMSTRQDLEIEDEAFGKLKLYGEWSENETVEPEGFCEYASVLPHTDKKIIYEMIEENISSLSKEKDKVETLLRDANKDEGTKAPQNVKPKPVAVNTKELAEKPKEPAGDDYQVVRAATVMKAEDREEFKVETFTQLIEGNIDWVGEEYVKPVKPVNSPYMCRRIDVTAPCKRVEFMFGIIKGTLTEEELWKSFLDEIKAQFKHEPSSMSLFDFELVFFLIYASDHFYVVVFNIKKPKTMVILYNNDSGYTYASKYKEACDPLPRWENDPQKLDTAPDSLRVKKGVKSLDQQLSMLQRLRYKITTKIMLHQFNDVSNKMFDFAFTFETKNTDAANVVVEIFVKLMVVVDGRMVEVMVLCCISKSDAMKFKI